MNQHLSSMLEHLSLSSLRRKNSDSGQASSNSDKQLAQLKADDSDYKDVSGDVESMSSKTKNIFKDLISDNGATTIFHNLNFIKCTSTSSNGSDTVSSSSTNGTCRKEQQKSINGNSLHTANLLHPTTNETNNVENHNQLQSSSSMNGKAIVAANGKSDLSIKRELSPPSNRIHRKSSHDIRIQRNNHMLDALEQDMGKSTSVVRPLRIKNIITQNETCDTLHCRAMDVSIFVNLLFIDLCLSVELFCGF